MDIFVFNQNLANNFSMELLGRFAYKTCANINKQKIHCLTYFMLDSILKDFYNIEDTSIEFVSKKPQLKSLKKHFSLSHSGEYIVIVVSDSNCGVDIEKIIERDYEKISERMKFTSNSLVDFYKNWTNYESQYKLNSVCKNKKIFQLDNYMITAMSENSSETYTIYYNKEKEFLK